VAFVISDFILPAGTDVVDRQMRSTARRHELINVVISDPGEFALPPGGIVTCRDLETGQWFQVDAGNRQVRNAYAELRRAALHGVLDQFKAADLDCIQIGTQDSAADALWRYFRMRERRKR
jgi:hypothetical protein